MGLEALDECQRGIQRISLSGQRRETAAFLLVVYFAVWMLDSCLAGCSSRSWLIFGGLLVKESNVLSFQSCFTAAVDDGDQ